MSLDHRLTRLERAYGADRPKVLVVQVPAGASDEQVAELKQAEMDRLGLKDDRGQLIVYLLRFV